MTGHALWEAKICRLQGLDEHKKTAQATGKKYLTMTVHV